MTMRSQNFLFHDIVRPQNYFSNLKLVGEFSRFCARYPLLHLVRYSNNDIYNKKADANISLLTESSKF